MRSPALSVTDRRTVLTATSEEKGPPASRDLLVPLHHSARVLAGDADLGVADQAEFIRFPLQKGVFGDVVDPVAGAGAGELCFPANVVVIGSGRVVYEHDLIGLIRMASGAGCYRLVCQERSVN